MALVVLLAFSALQAFGDDDEKPRIADYLKPSPNNPPVKAVRLRYVIVRVPMNAMADALLKDTGKSDKYWQQQLDAWETAGQAEVVAPSGTYHYLEGPSGKELRSGRERSFRSLNQWQVASYWCALLDNKTQNLPPPDPVRNLLQEMDVQESEPEAQATLSLLPGLQFADANIRLRFQAELERREITTWPIGLMKVDRYLFRPWKLDLQGRFPVNTTLFLGTQMEPPHDGQVHTGHVLAAFGIISLGTEAKAENDGPLPHPGVHVQSWTLAVPLNKAVPWIMQRDSAGRDDIALRDWLGSALQKGDTELLATSAVAISDGAQASIESALEWNDGWGYEPMQAMTDFRVAPCDPGRFSLTHELKLLLSAEAGTNATVDNLISAPQFWRARIETIRPSQTTRWIKLKTAMERTDETDPGAIEIGQCSQVGWSDSAKERTVSSLTLFNNQVVLSGAVRRGDRVHVTFHRLVEDEVTRKAKPEGLVKAPLTPMLTTWIIETPLSWEPRLLKAERATELQSVARDLLQALLRGEVSLAGQLMATETAIGTEHRLFNGNDYVNTCVAPQGIFFNTRAVGSQSVGDHVTASVSSNKASRLELQLQSFGEPELRHWGMWQPRVKATTAENSGLTQPIFPKVTLKGTWQLEPGAPQVIAAMRVNEPGRVQPIEPRLRWYVLRLDAPYVEEEEPKDFAIVDPSWQALVIAAPENDLPTAAALLDETRQGKRVVLEQLTLRECSDINAAIGSAMHYLNGRDDKDDPNAPEQLPEGKGFEVQTHCCERTLGLQLEYQSTNQAWKLAHDIGFPKVVTDTFKEAYREFPFDDKVPFDHPSRRTSVCVQRPIFSTTRADFEAALPKPGEAFAKRLSKQHALLVRRLK